MAIHVDQAEQPKHLHVSRESRDCDGRYSSTRISPQSIYEWAGFAAVGHEEAFVRTEYSEGFRIVSVSAQTDEGYESSTATECDDPTCDPEQYTQRDHTAEAAGY